MTHVGQGWGTGGARCSGALGERAKSFGAKGGHAGARFGAQAVCPAPLVGEPGHAGRQGSVKAVRRALRRAPDRGCFGGAAARPLRTVPTGGPVDVLELRYLRNGLLMPLSAGAAMCKTTDSRANSVTARRKSLSGRIGQGIQSPRRVS